MSRTPKTNRVYCPHCDSNNEPYFSRSVPMGFYCRDCGKDVDEKQSDQTMSELAAAREQRDRLAEAGKILAEEYEDRRSQWGGEYLWQKYEDAERVDAAIAVFTVAMEGGSDE